MTHFRALGLLLLAGLVLSPQAAGQSRRNPAPRLSPNATVSQTIGITEVTVTYGRPSVRERQLLGGLMPTDRVWRTGANEATVITFSTEVTVEDQTIPAGAYSLFTRPGEATWVIILNGETGQWGLMRDEKQDLFVATVIPAAGPWVEQMTFRFSEVTDHGATLQLAWGDMVVPIQLGVDTDETMRVHGDAVVARATDYIVGYEASSWALRTKLHMEAAVEWASASVRHEANFFNAMTKANLLEALGRLDEAATAAIKVRDAISPTGLFPMTFELPESYEEEIRRMVQQANRQ